MVREKVSSAGCQIESQITVKDEENSIVSGLNYCLQDKPDYLLVTGGLGPTNDDVTRNVLFNYLETNSEFDMNIGKFLKASISEWENKFQSLSKPGYSS